MRRPKVLHISTVDVSLRYLLLNQMLFLQEKGYDVVGVSAPGPDVPHIQSAGIRHVPVLLTRSLTPLADLSSLLRLCRVMLREQPVIVHTHTPKAGLLGQLAARFTRVPIVINTVHGFYFHDGMSQWSRRFFIATETVAARCSHAILSQNREDIATAVRERICGQDKISYLGNGIDIVRFDRSRVSDRVVAAKRRQFGLVGKGPIVGFVGRLVREKGLYELLEAGAILRRTFPSLRLLIVGPSDTAKADALGSAAAVEAGVADLCVFTGVQQEMPELYALMDVFVLPSHREGFPRSPMEASATGVPSVVTDIRGCREVVTHGENGLLVVPRDSAALAQAILDLLINKDVASGMADRARQMAEQLFDERIVFERVAQQYSRLLGEKGLSLPVAASSRTSGSPGRDTF